MIYYGNELYHNGIKGREWGDRKSKKEKEENERKKARL